MIPYTHFLALALAFALGALKGYVDGTIIAGGGRIRHGLHLGVWALLLIAIVAGYAWGRPLDWPTLGGTVLSAWGLSAFTFRAFLGQITGWGFDYIGTTSVYDRTLLWLFGEHAGRVAAAAEFGLFIAGLVWYWA